MNPSQFAINSVSTRAASLEEMLAAYHEAGFRNVEFCLPHVKENLRLGHTVADVRGLLGRYEMRCIGGFEGTVEAFSPTEQRKANLAMLLENATLVSALGGTCMVVGTDGPAAEGAEKIDVLSALAKRFAEVASAIEKTGVTLCIEFNWSPVVKSLRTAAEVARRSGSPRVGVVFDPAHYHCTPSKFDQLNDQNIPFIRHVHVDDMRDKPGELSNCNADRVLPGEGIMDLRALLGRIEAGGYKGFFSIEMFNEELWSLPAREAAKRMYRSLQKLL
jgi:sugar phosphate isomerase/epimerase